MGDADKGGLLALAERCEQATGPDRELESAIVKAIHPGAKVLTTEIGKGKFTFAGGFFRLDDFRYTASLDAAITLVPEGWRVVSIGEEAFDDEPQPFVVSLCQRAGRFGAGATRGRATAFALALCAAALRARIAQPGSEHP